MLGSNAGFERAGLPITIRLTRINTYQYFAMVPKDRAAGGGDERHGPAQPGRAGRVQADDGQDGGGMSKKSEAALNPIVERFEAYWLDELLPEIKQHLAYFESCDLRGMSLDQLRAHLAETLKRVGSWAPCMESSMPSAYAMSQFEELYCELFEGASTLDALQLTQGFDNKILEGDRALWRLSRAALATPEVRAILSGHAPGEVIPALEKSEASQPFLADLRAWLAHYGQRLNSAFALGQPSWIEDPTPAIEYLQAYLAQAEPRPEMEPAGWPPSASKRWPRRAPNSPVIHSRSSLALKLLLKAAQTAVIVLEDHNFWIDQRLFYHVRRIILEFGGRLAQAGTLEAASDVFYLTPDELQNGRDVP